MAGFISLADAKAQLRVLHDSEDGLIQSLINAASKHVERLTGYVAGQREETFSFDRFARQLELRLRPVVADSIVLAYLDSAGAWQDFADLRVALHNGTTRVLPAIGARWPASACGPGVILVTADVGFVVSDTGEAEDVPDNIKHAVRVCVASWFQDRAEGPVPQAFHDLLDDDRARRV